MRALKVLVVVMGVLLVAGFAVVVVTIMSRISQRGTPPAAPAVAHLTPFGDATVTLPSDSLVMEVQGAGERIFLRLELADGSEMLLILDAATGAELGRIKLEREKSQ
jgi:hypothetical protein